MWAPWRKIYLRSSSSKRSGCLFCRLLKDRRDKKNLVLLRAAHHAVLLNRFPYNNGHLMIVPNRHIACLSQMNQWEREEFFEVFEKVRKALEKAMRAQGFNLGMNISDVAGAGIPGHLHWHIVPRWKGDVNFMPIMGGAKVISESLESAYEVLSRALTGKASDGQRKKRKKK